MTAGLMERALSGSRARVAGMPPARVRLDAVVPGDGARLVLAPVVHDWARWDLAARAERGYWEPGGAGPGMVRVTASGVVDGSAWRLRGGLAGLGAGGFAQGGYGDGMAPGPLLGVLLEHAVTGSPRLGAVAGWDGSGFPSASAFSPSLSSGLPAAGVEAAWQSVYREQRAAGGDLPGVPLLGEPEADAAAAALASAEAGAGPLAGVPGVPGADGVRGLTGNELLGAMAAAQRQANRNEWLELAVLAEFARRRYAELQASADRGDGPGRRSGEFFTEEVAWAAVRPAREAEERTELAVAMTTRLPELGSRMAEGALNSYRLLVVHRATAELSTQNARIVDAALAPDAPGLTPEALRKRAWRLALKLDPAAAAEKKKKGKAKRRTEMWMEESGNAAFAGRELDPEDALAANAYYDAVAKLLRKAGLPGSLRELRHLAFVDRNTGRDPLARIGHLTGGAGTDGTDGPDAGSRDGLDGSDGLDAPGDAGTRGSDADPREWRPGDLRDDGYRDDEPPPGPDFLDDEDEDDSGDGEGNGGPDGGPGPGGDGGLSGGPAAPSKASPAANIHLLVPVGTALGWSTAPGDLDRFGPLDAGSTRDLVTSAARNPATRWHVTLVGEDGEAVAHACARGPRPDAVQSVQTVNDGAAAPSVEDRAAQVGALLDRLGITEFEPVAKGGCDHRHREDGYTPSRKLGDLIRARTATCPAPVCGASAIHNDLDHTVPWPEGETDECNLSPPCRRHHRQKQAPGWRLEQVSPGEMRWTTPSGRIHETHPTRYDT